MLGSTWDTSLRPRSVERRPLRAKSSVLHKPITGTQPLLLHVAHHHDIKVRTCVTVRIRSLYTPMGRRHHILGAYTFTGWGRRDDEDGPILGFNVVADE